MLQDHYDDERDKIVFHKTTPELQDQDQDRFFGLRPVLSIDDGLRPHHWRSKPEHVIESQSIST